jgi:hypothetical protein
VADRFDCNTDLQAQGSEKVVKINQHMVCTIQHNRQIHISIIVERQDTTDDYRDGRMMK